MGNMFGDLIADALEAQRIVDRYEFEKLPADRELQQALDTLVALAVLFPHHKD